MTTPRPAATTRESAFVVPPPASPTDGVPRTLIVSDVRLYREGLAVTLGAREELRIVGTADDVAAARRCIAARAPDVVLLDTGMRDALRLARELRREDGGGGGGGGARRGAAFAVAESGGGADVIACAEAGVAGYVSRDGTVDDVVRAVRDAVRGELRCSPRMAASLFERLALLSSRRRPTTPADEGTADGESNPL